LEGGFLADEGPWHVVEKNGPEASRTKCNRDTKLVYLSIAQKTRGEQKMISSVQYLNEAVVEEEPDH
jgi:hypothetical protein